MAPRWAGEGALVAALLLLLAVAVVYPLLQILAVAALDGGRPTLGPILAALARPLLREALTNTLLAGVLAVAIGSAIAVPLAMLSARWRFPGRALIGALAVPPLAIPPFVGAVGFQQILGPRGTVNLLLRECGGVTVPFMEGLAGVVLVQSLHYFPVILLSTAAAPGLARPIARGRGSHPRRLGARPPAARAAVADAAGLRRGRARDLRAGDRRPRHPAGARLPRAARSPRPTCA